MAQWIWRSATERRRRKKTISLIAPRTHRPSLRTRALHVHALCVSRTQNFAAIISPFQPSLPRLLPTSNPSHGTLLCPAVCPLPAWLEDGGVKRTARVKAKYLPNESSMNKARA